MRYSGLDTMQLNLLIGATADEAYAGSTRVRSDHIICHSRTPSQHATPHPSHTSRQLLHYDALTHAYVVREVLHYDALTHAYAVREVHVKSNKIPGPRHTLDQAVRSHLHLHWHWRRGPWPRVRDRPHESPRTGPWPRDAPPTCATECASAGPTP